MGAALQNLARFIRAKDVDGERHEVREYVIAHAADLAEAFGVSASAFAHGIANVEEDARLARRLLGETKRAGQQSRVAQAAERARLAQASADIIGAAVIWKDGRAGVDVISLLAAVRRGRCDALVFIADPFTVSMPTSRLVQLARLRRPDLTGFVDASGLHIRWATGGLNFRSPKADPKASSTMTVHLSACVAVRVA